MKVFLWCLNSVFDGGKSLLSRDSLITRVYNLQATHPFDAASEKELSLAVGDYVVVRKVDKYFSRAEFYFIYFFHMHECVCLQALFSSNEYVHVVTSHLSYLVPWS